MFNKHKYFIIIYYRRDYYRIIDIEIKSINTYFNATDINIYKQMEYIITNTEQHIYIIKDYP